MQNVADQKTPCEIVAAAADIDAALVAVGKGRYSAAAAQYARDAVRLTGIDFKNAVMAAIEWSTDYGRAMAKTTATPKYGSTSKEGQITLGEAVSRIKVPETYALKLGAALDAANKLSQRFDPHVRVEVLTLGGKLQDWVIDLI